MLNSKKASLLAVVALSISVMSPMLSNDVIYVKIESKSDSVNSLKKYVVAALVGGVTGAASGMIDKGLSKGMSGYYFSGLAFDAENRWAGFGLLSALMNWFLEPRVRANIINDIHDVADAESRLTMQDVALIASWLAYVKVIIS